jgi:hypothetical protein
LEKSNDHIDFNTMKQTELTTVLLLSAAAFIAGGCAPLTNDEGGGSGTGCAASILEDDAGAQIAINTSNVTVGTVVGTTTQLAQAFLATTSATIPEISLKLDAVAPQGTTLTYGVTAQIQKDSLTTTAGTSASPTSPSGAAVASGAITATGAILASSITASTSASSTVPGFYDFCFIGASGVNCPAAGTGTTTAGVTLTAGQYYWIVVTTTASGTSTAFVEWRATKTQTTGYAGYVNLNGLNNWLPLNGFGTTNYNFDFKLGC